MEGELQEREVPVGGLAVRYQAGGSGPPVVLVHGLAGSTRWWATTIPALLPHYHVLLVDLPGFGGLRGRAYRFVLAEAAAWLRAWMGALGLPAVHLVGHSMGGYLAMEVAARWPAAVNRLVLVDAAGVPAGRSMVRQAPRLAVELPRVRPRFWPVLIADAWRAGPRTLWGAARDIVAADVRPQLAGIRAPTLLVWGARDLLVPPAAGRRLRAAIPGARLLILPAAGHIPNGRPAGRLQHRPAELPGRPTRRPLTRRDNRPPQGGAAGRSPTRASARGVGRRGLPAQPGLQIIAQRQEHAPEPQE